MPPINPSHLARVRGCLMRPEAIATIFEGMSQAIDSVGVEATEMTLSFNKPGDVILEGEFTPVIILALRPLQVSDARPTDDVPPGSTEP